MRKKENNLKTVSFKDAMPLLGSPVKTDGGLALVLAFATAFGRMLSLARATGAAEAFIVGNFRSSFTVMTARVIIFPLPGMVMLLPLSACGSLSAGKHRLIGARTGFHIRW